MQNLIKGVVFALSLAVAGGVFATDRPDHFKGLASPDLQTAVKNFSDYNVSVTATPPFSAVFYH